jgi:hypothetical protein
MTRVQQAAFLASLLWCAWLGMQLVHELGHVAAAYATGGRVERVVFHPLTISRTDVAPNPAPLAVAWAGPLCGSIVPSLAAGVFRMGNWRGRRFAEFFAGFCLIANGAYLGLGAFTGAGDAGDLLHYGADRGALIVFGLVAAVAGLWNWHRTSGDFGFGARPRPLTQGDLWSALAVAAGLTIAGLLAGSR